MESDVSCNIVTLNLNNIQVVNININRIMPLTGIKSGIVEGKCVGVDG